MFTSLNILKQKYEQPIVKTNVTLETVSRNMPGRTGNGLRPETLAWREQEFGVKFMHHQAHEFSITRQFLLFVQITEQLTLPAIPPENFLPTPPSSFSELSAPSSLPCITLFIMSRTVFPGLRATSLVKKLTCEMRYHQYTSKSSGSSFPNQMVMMDIKLWTSDSGSILRPRSFLSSSIPPPIIFLASSLIKTSLASSFRSGTTARDSIVCKRCVRHGS